MRLAGERRGRVYLIGGTLLCVLPILLPCIPGLVLPELPALRTALVLLGVLLLPGYLLDELLRVSGDRIGLASPATWFVLSIGLLAPAGWFVLWSHSSLRPFGLITAGLSIVLLVLVLATKGKARPIAWPWRRDEVWLWVVVLVIMLTTVGLAIWTGRGSSDDWTYGAYLAEYVESEEINRWDPFLGEGFLPGARMRYDTWLATQAFVAYAAGIDPVYQLLDILNPILVLLALMAAYVLAEAVLGSRRRALVGFCFQVLVFLFTAPTGGTGYWLLNRITQDKYTAMLILVPVGLALTYRVVTRNERSAWWGVAFLGAGLIGTHGQIFVLFCTACGLFFLSLLAFRMCREQLIRLVKVMLLLAPWSALVFFTIVQTAQLGPDVGGLGWDTLVEFRAGRDRAIFLGDTSLYLVHPKYVASTVTMVGLLITPLLLWSRSRRESAALLFGNQIGPLILMFVPGIPNFVGLFVKYDMLYRFAWLMMPALTIAYVLTTGWPFEKSILDLGRSWYINWTASTRIILWCGVGGISIISWLLLVDYAAGARSRWGPGDDLYEILAGAAPAVAQMDQPVVLASKTETYKISSSWPQARTLITRGLIGTMGHFPPDRQQEPFERMALVESLPTDRAESAEFVRRLEELQVDLILVNRREASEMERSLERFPFAYPLVLQTSNHAIYLVNLKGDSMSAIVGRAQIALAGGDHEGGCRLFDKALTENPGSALAMLGAGLCQELQDDLIQARLYYEPVLEELAQNPWTIGCPDSLSPWLVASPYLRTSLFEPVRASSAAFAWERLSALDREVRVDTANSVWIDGWPRQAVTLPLNSLIALMPEDISGSDFQVYVRIEGTTRGQSVVPVALFETPAGMVMARVKLLREGGDLLLDVKTPAGGYDRAWVGVSSTASKGAATWYGLQEAEVASGWMAPGLAFEEGVLFAEWLSDQVEDHFDGQLDYREAQIYSDILLNNAVHPLRGVIDAGNLVENSRFDGGVLTGWQSVAPSHGIVHSADFGAAGDDDWMARIEGDDESYHGGLCQSIDVQPGQPYLYMVSARAELHQGSESILGYWDYRRLGFARANKEYTVDEWTDWTSYWQTVEFPVGTRVVSICPALLIGPGAVLFDDVWFLPLSVFR